eukprot:GHVQ01027177.1.p1 GENE.GHVQ01027177.1~~GHVQ01027177.1.p1  ORF type:complete len:538 (+),score=76.93 GHVQ01027177.1:210-1823(+)
MASNYGTTTPPWVYIVPHVQKYDWGVNGEESLVAQLAVKNTARAQKLVSDVMGITKIEQIAYAELWLGNHKNGMCFVLCDNKYIEYDSSDNLLRIDNASRHETNDKGSDDPKAIADMELCSLDRFIDLFPEYCTVSDAAELGKIPFLFKVLSVARPLSIQAHPDKETAARIHKEQPKVYKDGNHKPEMAIALGPVEVYCGWRKFSQIAFFIKNVPEFKELLDERYWERHDNVLEEYAAKVDFDEEEVGVGLEGSAAETALKEAFAGVIRHDEESIEKATNNMLNRLRWAHKVTAKNGEQETASWKFLHRTYLRFVYIFNRNGHDVGVWSVFFLTPRQLKPGEALFIGPNMLHYYVQGTILECMANSDNVVRGGLTTKYKDAKLLTKMLYYDDERGANVTTVSPAVCENVPQDSNNSTVSKLPDTVRLGVYRPPAKEFQVIELRLSTGGELLNHIFSSKGPALGIVLQGSVVMKHKSVVTEFKTGDTMMLPRGVDVSICNANTSKTDKVPDCEITSEELASGENRDGVALMYFAVVNV